MIRKAESYRLMEPTKKQKLRIQNAEKYKVMDPNKKQQLRASAHKYGPNNGTSRKIDFAQILPIDWP